MFGFTGISAATAEVARLLFFVAIVIFVVLLVAGLIAGSTLFYAGRALCAAHTRNLHAVVAWAHDRARYTAGPMSTDPAKRCPYPCSRSARTAPAPEALASGAPASEAPASEAPASEA